MFRDRMLDAENLRLPRVSRLVPYLVAREVPGEGPQLKLKPGPVICVQSPCPVSLSVLQKAPLNPLPSFESHDMSSLW